MITKTPSETCPGCDRVIPPAMPEGLCPACLAAVAVEDVDAPLPPHAFDSTDNLQEMRFFGDFELLEEIGRGGTGIVFKARQLGMNRIVALKVLVGGVAAGREFVHRFHTEAATAARLEHPHVVSVYEFGTHEGAHFLTMRFMEGGTLLDQIRREPLSSKDAAQLLIPIARAVQYAHEHGVLHRDLKPSNILMDAEGVPFVGDFGLARVFDDEDGLTVSDSVMGTVGYLPPEIARCGVGAATTLSDIYGLGAILHEMLSAKPPFIGPGIAEILRKVQETEPALIVGEPDLRTICLKCLHKDPAKRYRTA